MMETRKRTTESEFWLIPKEIYKPLDREFKFDFDPCPYPYKRDGIDIEWGKVNWVNPPFRAKDAKNGHGPTAFVRKAIEEQKKGKTSVLILPVLSMLNMLFEAKAEVRSCGRVAWINAKTGEKWKAPSNCALFILRGKEVGIKRKGGRQFLPHLKMWVSLPNLYEIKNINKNT